ncbi:Fanconi anemia group J protein homolog [Ananas comosus]|uniref:DNA 5'-3' helicase FANCJ n=1 Tax=Ananas comosus TaxID=4615 RepID=A0A6P5EEN6_ANACO|nr:Fanconi anemia group J protein homolog [Ananas comosus]
MTASIDLSTPLQSPNPNPSSIPNPNHSPQANVYRIGGVPVEFPYKPYGSQLAFMGRVISTLSRARHQGHSHALLESPTGTGKTLSLLCSALAWQQDQLRRPPPLAPSPQPPPATGPTPDPLLHGGGFVPEPEPSRNTEQSPPAVSVRAQKKAVTPTIYYASRTHSQISQVIREYKKTSYRVPMAVLASRKHYCTNEDVCASGNVDEECKLRLKDANLGCLQFKNANKLKAHPSLQRGGCHEVHDIEDLVNLGRKVKGCAYFAAQTMAADAQLVFAPYSYIINPIVRRAMDVDIKGSIVILDEAHNIEDIARDAGSVDIDEDVLCTLQTELGQLCMADSLAMIYQPLYDVIQGLISWIADRKEKLQKREFERYSTYWSGDMAIRELQYAGITQQCFQILQECATKAVKAASDVESDGAHLSGMPAIMLEGLFSSLSYLFSGNCCYSSEYQLALQRYVKRDNGIVSWKCTMSLWCLNPAVVFRDIANLSLSVILTSGTLSPMGSFASELGVQFETCMEAPHVIDVQSQLWAAVVSSGPGNSHLNASYKHADGYAFQDALGASLEEICRVVPGGALVFFPSYKLLDKVRARWSQTGQWSQLNAQKPLFVEPRGTFEEFEPVLKCYYDAILGKKKAGPGKGRNGSKRTSDTTKASSQNHVKGGAAFLAVCRGKVSEGIDFSDENARVVVIVGIPFPNINDVQVVLKKRYNDTYKSSKGLLSGSEWYCHQAFRALNQAAGRCIRHRFDYGAIILLDERYKEEQNRAYISKWLKNSIKHYGSFEETLDGLRTFFENVEKQKKTKMEETGNKDELQIDVLPFDTNKRLLPWPEPNFSSQKIPQKKNQTSKKSNQHAERKTIIDDLTATKPKQLAKSSTPLVLGEAPFSSLMAQCLVERKPASKTNSKVLNSCENYAMFEDTTLEYSRYSEPSLLSQNSLHQSIPVRQVLEKSCVMECSKEENLYTVAVNASNQSIYMPSFPVSTTTSKGSPSDGPCMSAVTPEKVAYVDLSKPEKESPLNASVNSHCQKRRKLTTSQLTSCTYKNHFSSPQLTDKRFELTPTNNCPNPKIQKLIEKFLGKKSSTLPLLPQKSVQKKLHICCLHCEIPLGLSKNGFLIPCSLSSSSKFYLGYVRKFGPPSIYSLDNISRIQRKLVPILVCESSLVNNQIFSRCSNGGTMRHGVWSEEDGCVFRTITCPRCTTSNACLGAQILATDASNVHLLNKVLFYADYVDIKDHASKPEAMRPASSDATLRRSPLINAEKYVYNSRPHGSVPLNQKSSKLKLPKKDPLAT